MKKTKKLTQKSCGHKTVPLDHFQRYKIILESVDTILYPHTNLYPTLHTITYHCIPLHTIAYHYIPLHTINHIPLHTNTIHYMQIITNQYIPLLTNTYHYMPLHTTTYHYIGCQHTAPKPFQ